jgi:hypothetical protein
MFSVEISEHCLDLSQKGLEFVKEQILPCLDQRAFRTQQPQHLEDILQAL